MIGASKILTVSYGTFSCTLEGFDDPFNTMKAIAEYFRDLAADDRYFGAEPPTPDAAMLHRIAEREVQRRVEAKIQDNGVILRAGDLIAPAVAEPVPAPASAPAPMAPTVAAAAPVAPVAEPAPPMMALLAEESVAAKLQRIRAAVARTAVVAPVVLDTPVLHTPVEDAVFVEDEHAEAAAPLVAEAPVAGPLDDPDLAALEAEDDAMIASLRDDWQAIDEADEVQADADLLRAFDAEPANDDAPLVNGAAAGFDLDTAEAVAVPAQEAAAEDDALFASLAAAREAADALPVEEPAPEERVEDDLPELLAADLAPADDLLPEDLAADDLAPEDFGGEPVAPDTFVEAADGTGDRDALIAALAADSLRPVDGEPPMDDLAELLDTIAAEATAGPQDEDYDDEMDVDLALDSTPEDETDPEEQAELEALDQVAASIDAQEDSAADEEVAEAAPAVLTLTAADRADIADSDDAAGDAGDADDAATLPVAEKLRRARARVIKVRRPDAETDDADAAMLAPEAEADLQRQLDSAADDDADDEEDGRPAEREGRTILEANAKGDEDVTRLLRQTNTEMDGPENRRRMSTLAHLKAAVAATVAELRSPGAPSENGEASRLDRYRADLARVVRPRRSADTPLSERPAPLVLVSEQRIDRPTPVDTVPGRIMPRRVTAGNLAIEDEDDAIESDEAENIFATSKNFVEFAERLGASELPDLLEAAAAYTATIEGRPHFTRPHLMRHVAAVTEDNDQNREDSMRSFGQLLRQGKIEKVKRGQFAITASSHYLAEARRMAP